MRRIKQTSLKSTLFGEDSMKQRPPNRVRQVAVYGGFKFFIKRAARTMALNQPASGDEFRVSVPHAILKSRRAGEWGELNRHVVAKVQRVKMLQKQPECLLGAEMEGIVESADQWTESRIGWKKLWAEW